MRLNTVYTVSNLLSDDLKLIIIETLFDIGLIFNDENLDKVKFNEDLSKEELIRKLKIPVKSVQPI